VSATSDLAGVLPRIGFAVIGAAGLDPAAVPTLRVQLSIEADADLDVRSIVLDVQVQIAARRRGYAPQEQPRLLELFGTPERWGTTLRTLPWLRTTVVVPAFTSSTSVAVDLPCTYDLEVTAARYFAALEHGDVPLEFLFSGSVFFTDARGALQTSRIGWDQEAAYRMPVAVWREMMDRHFPGGAWLRLGRGAFDRLAAFKAQGMYVSWDDALEALLSR
jgi:Family of unknown function (DUF6084)